MFYNNYKWSIAFKNGESPFRMPKTHIILQILQLKTREREIALGWEWTVALVNRCLLFVCVK